MPKYYKDFRITGSANSTVFDEGVDSTEAEKKRIVGVMLNLSGYADNTIEINIDREKIVGIPDYFLDTEANDGDTNTPYSTRKMQFIELGHDLELGQTLQVGIKSGATAKNVRGSYVYEII